MTPEERQPMPAVDLLIVGGGPAGTAAAFRARELGLAPLVVDFDDLMKRIRDYSKDKLILPGFGGGDRQRFPRCGEMVNGLRFAPIDKDDLCRTYKDLYERHSVPYRVGLELTGIEPRAEGGHEVRLWDHGAGCEERMTARSVVLAIGRGVPRRFDIPGETEGIPFKLRDPAVYVGRPACIIGGGTSAAEAVIAVSNAKAAAGDPSAVYWSYRGDRLPRVSKALADAFFAAYMGNGNVRYYPRSEPAAVVTADDHEQYLAVRVDRRRLEGRPSETVHLEFPKDACLACIGEDVPEQLLASLGIEMPTGGPHGRKRMAVTRWLESRVPGVYLAGDLLSQAYFETDDFDADPAGFREVKHRGNIKSALRDGVLVAEVVSQRLAGRQRPEVSIEEFDEPDTEPPMPPPRGNVDGPPHASLVPLRQVRRPEALLVRLLPTGVEADEQGIYAGRVTTIGRRGCDVNVPEDTLLSDCHASISTDSDGCHLRDDGSETGVFLRVPAARKTELEVGDLVRAGRQFLRVTSARDGFALVHYDAGGSEVGRYPLGDKPLVMGRRAPGVSLDADDTTLSRRHLAAVVEGKTVVLKDLKSLNGTYRRVRQATRLEHGDQIRMGQQLFVFSRETQAVLDTAGEPVGDVAPPPVPAAGARVTFRPGGETFANPDGVTVCEVAERNGVALTAECHSGICGSDPVRILAGRDNVLAEAGDQERETLEDLCELEPGECRLACMLRAKGEIEVEIL